MKTLAELLCALRRTQSKRTNSLMRLCFTMPLGMLVLCMGHPAGAAPKTPRTPNILFIIMDDVGIDQLRAFNPLTPNPVRTPNLDTLIHHGVAFNNCWMMPECSPSRVCMFTGRWP